MVKLIVVLFIICVQSVFAQSDSIYLWPHSVPGETKPKEVPVSTTLADGSIRVIEVTDPFLAVFKPKISNSKAIIICPGGGYVRIAVHKEGYRVALWLKELGYTVFVLQYRVPNKRDGALQDLQRSIRFVRFHATELGINSERIAAMGFSAGAHMVATAGLTDDQPTYAEQDAADKLPHKPDRMVVIYPAYLADTSGLKLSSGLKPTSDTPDTFIFQTMDDPLAPSAFALARALQNAGANVELHMLPNGGHGFGMDPGNKAAEAWPKMLETWLAEHF
jgi:acetyl esterase/lipase